MPEGIRKIVLLRALVEKAGITLLIMTSPMLSHAQHIGRPLTPVDITRMETIVLDPEWSQAWSSYGFSPDGRFFAYTLRRSLQSSASQLTATGGFVDHWADGHDRDDVWIYDVVHGTTTNVTDGAKTGSGFIKATWSPDGSRLAIVSLKGEGWNIDIWCATTGSLEQVATSKNAPQQGGFPEGIDWLSNQRVLIKIGFYREHSNTPWPISATEGQPSAIVQESPSRFSKFRSQLLIVDVDEVHVAATWPSGADELLGNLAMNPKRDSFALSVKEFETRSCGEWIADGYGHLIRQYVELYDEDGKLLGELSADTSLGEITGELSWSPDGRTLAFRTESSIETEDLGNVVLCTVSSLKCHRLDTPQLGKTQEMHWTVQGDLLVSSMETSRSDQTIAWWIIRRNGAITKISKDSDSIPESLVDVGDGENFVGVWKGKFLKWDSRSETWTTFLQPIPKDAHLVSGERVTCLKCGDPILYLESGQAKDKRTYRVSVKRDAIESESAPSPGSLLLGFVSQGGTRIYSSNLYPGQRDLTANSLYVCDGRKPECKGFVTINEYLSEVSATRQIKFKYQTIEGQDVDGTLLLPFGYKKGQRYPTVLSVYAGLADNSTITNDYDQYRDLRYGADEMLLSAHGYAVLKPSMPLGPEGLPEDTYGQMLNGVLPAIDKAVDLGVTDPNRLGIMGSSFGGYSVMSIITQSNRFGAAVEVSGVSNNIDEYGTFYGTSRYDPDPSCSSTHASTMENGQGRMGSPPWRDPERYVRNSPLFFVDRIETPLLLLHGDMDDAAPIEQSEEFFTALSRLDKRASYVHYINEGHMLPQRPENLEDAWRRIFAWFDEYLKNEPSTRTPEKGNN
jgi:dipeptidyl aminopeptidase/acylaminoacyl peptidase